MTTNALQTLAIDQEAQHPVAFLQAVAERLTLVLTEETTLLRGNNFPGITALQDGKQKLLRAYEEHLALFQQTPQQLADVPADARQALKVTLQNLHEVMQDNRRALKAARDSRRYVLEIIREAAMDQAQTLTAYTRKGESRHAVFRQPATLAAAPVALNQQL